jgi:hypothetical protein
LAIRLWSVQLSDMETARRAGGKARYSPRQSSRDSADCWLGRVESCGRLSRRIQVFEKTLLEGERIVGVV